MAGKFGSGEGLLPLREFELRHHRSGETNKQTERNWEA